MCTCGQDPSGSSGCKISRPGSKALGKISQLGHLAGSEARAHGVEGHIHTFFRRLGQTSDIDRCASIEGNQVPGFLGHFIVATTEGCLDQPKESSAGPRQAH
jgi:hypothetical protein